MLTRAAVRICVVRALRNNTFAGAAVRDSEITPMAPKMKDEQQPFIAVYTDDQDGKMAQISIQIGVSAAMAVENEEGQSDILPGVPLTDASIEFAIDMIERQVHVALADDQNPWAEIFRRFATVKDGLKSERGASFQEGERFAGRQILLPVELPSDPEFGRPVADKGNWRLFLDTLAADSDMDECRQIFESLLGVGETVLDWRLLQRAIQATRGQAEALGIAPFVGDEPAAIASFEVEGGPGQ